MRPVPPGTDLHDLPTPCLVIDEDGLAANVARAQAYADANGAALRPHAKTHKSPVLAAAQVAAGAVGVCVAKLGEAEAMADGGVEDLFVANTTVGAANAERAATLAERLRFRIGVDHPRQLNDLDAAGRARGVRIPVRIEVDVGAGRGGLPPKEAPALGADLAARAGVAYDGLYAYEGWTYGAADAQALTERHRAMQRELIALAGRVAAATGTRGVVSIGSTPSQTANVPLEPGIDEVRPGTSVFLDAAQAALAGGLDRCAAFVLATVVSVQGERAVLDAGSKALTSDARTGGVCATEGFGRVIGGPVLTRLSEEHGVIAGPEARTLSVGERVRIVPNHVCTAVNLFPRLILFRDGRVTRTLPVAARDRSA